MLNLRGGLLRRRGRGVLILKSSAPPSPPAIMSISPNTWFDSDYAGQDNTLITLNGTGFTGCTGLEIGSGANKAVLGVGSRLHNFVVVNATTVTFGFKYGFGVDGDGKAFNGGTGAWPIKIIHPTNGPSNADKTFSVFSDP